MQNTIAMLFECVPVFKTTMKSSDRPACIADQTPCV